MEYFKSYLIKSLQDEDVMELLRKIVNSKADNHSACNCGNIESSENEISKMKVSADNSDEVNALLCEIDRLNYTLQNLKEKHECEIKYFEAKLYAEKVKAEANESVSASKISYLEAQIENLKSKQK